MFYYYFILILGALFVIGAVFSFIANYGNKDFTPFDVGKRILILLFGILLLWVTLPSVKYVVMKEYDVVSGECFIDIDSSARSSLANFHMLDTDEIFTFNDLPSLDAYGKSIPYYCEVTATKDHMFEIGYKIYDIETRELLVTSE